MKPETAVAEENPRLRELKDAGQDPPASGQWVEVAEENPRLRELKGSVAIHCATAISSGRRRESQIKGIESTMGIYVDILNIQSRRRESQIKGIERNISKERDQVVSPGVAEENPRLRELKEALRQINCDAKVDVAEENPRLRELKVLNGSRRIIPTLSRRRESQIKGIESCPALGREPFPAVSQKRIPD